MSSDPKLDPRLKALLTKHHAECDILERELNAIVQQIEREAYFAESCAGEGFLRGYATSALTRGEAHTTKLVGTLADSFKLVRERRFPALAKQLTQLAN